MRSSRVLPETRSEVLRPTSGSGAGGARGCRRGAPGARHVPDRLRLPTTIRNTTPPLRPRRSRVRRRCADGARDRFRRRTGSPGVRRVSVTRRNPTTCGSTRGRGVAPLRASAAPLRGRGSEPRPRAGLWIRRGPDAAVPRPHRGRGPSSRPPSRAPTSVPTGVPVSRAGPRTGRRNGPADRLRQRPSRPARGRPPRPRRRPERSVVPGRRSGHVDGVPGALGERRATPTR